MSRHPSGSHAHFRELQQDAIAAAMAAKLALAGAMAAVLCVGGVQEMLPPENFVAQAAGEGELWLRWRYPAPFVGDVQEYHINCSVRGDLVYWAICLANGEDGDGPCFGEIVGHKVPGLQPDTWYTCQLDVVGAGEKRHLHSFGTTEAKTSKAFDPEFVVDVMGGVKSVERNDESMQDETVPGPRLRDMLESAEVRASASERCSPKESLRTLVSITEVMSSNGGTVYDEDGDAPDWIEVRFRGDQQESQLVCLSGWSLIDDFSEDALSNAFSREPWKFPDTPVRFPISGRIVLFASGKDRRDASKKLHTDFALSANGEPLTLFFRNDVVQSIDIPPLLRDIAYGVVEEHEHVEVPIANEASANIQWSELQVPTPGEKNSGPKIAPGPTVVEVTSDIRDLRDGEDLVVKAVAEVDGLETKASRAVLRYQNGFGKMKELEMKAVEHQNPASTGPAGPPALTTFESKILSSAFQPGDMLRWSVSVFDSKGGMTTKPAFQGRDRPQMYGTVIEDPTIPSKLPQFYWFVEDVEKAETRNGTRCSLMFLERFYENIFCRSRGVTSATWPKKKYKFKFHGNSFLFRQGERRVSDANLDSMYDELGEESYMRFALASAFFEEVGVPVPIAFHVRMSQNNEFQGLYTLVEQLDETFLKRNNLDPAGSLYKALGTESNLRPGIQESHLAYHFKKMTRKSKEYDWSDLADLIEALSKPGVEPFLFDNVNLPQVINEMAAQTAILNHDRCTKNYFLLRDSKTNEWMRLPWDLDGALGIGSGYGGVEPQDGYCVLTCEQFNSPLFCDKDHPQDVAILYNSIGRVSVQDQSISADRDIGGTESTSPEWKENYNHLTDALLRVPRIREMYLRRLRSIMDNVLSGSFLEDKVRYIADLIKYDAKLDNDKWGTGDLEIGVKQLLEEQIPTRREILFQQYGPAGNGLIPDKQSEGLPVALHSLNTHSTEGLELMTYLEFKNPNPEALDISSWKILGGVSFNFTPGTVIPSWDSVFVSPDVLQFRQRSFEPHGGQARFVVGPLLGKLSKRQRITLEDPSGRVVLEFTT